MTITPLERFLLECFAMTSCVSEPDRYATPFVSVAASAAIVATTSFAILISPVLSSTGIVTSPDSDSNPTTVPPLLLSIVLPFCIKSNQKTFVKKLFCLCCSHQCNADLRCTYGSLAFYNIFDLSKLCIC